MERWYLFFRERLLSPYVLLLSLGLSLSGQFFGGAQFYFIPTLMTFIGMLLFFAMFHLIREIKDYPKDKVAHPDYPIPQGIITLPAAQAMFYRGQMVLYFFSVLLWIFFSQLAAFTFAVAAVYLWHIYKGFYFEEWMKRHPMTHAWVEQLVFLPLALFAVAMGSSFSALTISAFSWSLMMYGAFMTYELCRNLDPMAHPILVTYTQYYGYHKLFFYLAMTVIITFFSAISLGVAWILWPMEGVVLTALVVLYFNSHLHFLAYYSALVSLMLHAWSLFLVPLLRFSY
ncbi:MAG: UbiA family prenyltransferase [Chlamydiales bacterium]|nr:UbiA family prenyltransferase [Chlamydiia bacterium]MCP5507707.1 UbiA family prenyltransferase [Chlamydiales bacterium]